MIKLLPMVIGIMTLFISTANALEMEFGRFNLSDVTQNDCISQDCTIEFDKSYATTPVVFLMDTINFQDEYDAPSSLKILNVTSSSVTFRQVAAPDSRVDSYRYSPMLVKRMTEIDYLIAEKGVHTFDNDVKVIVGSHSTTNFQANRYPFLFRSSSPTYARWDTLRFNDYEPGFSFTSTPGILHQVQSTNNGDDFWITSTVQSVGTTQFQLALERSEVGGGLLWYQMPEYPSVSEEIGFLAAYGEGYDDDVQFSIGSKQSIDTLGNTSPVTYGCESYTTYGPYASRPILIANKNTRIGNNGGWLRRCRLETNRAAFMIDEDLDADTDRSHLAETVGYALFELPLEFNQQCEVFNGTVQTWVPENDANGNPQADGTFRINSSDVFETKNHRIGFLDKKITNQNLNNNRGCFIGDNTSSTVSACLGYEGTSPDYRIDNKPNFNEINIGSDTISVNNGQSQSITSGQYRDFDVKGELILGPGEYYVGKVSLKNGGTIKIRGAVAIYTSNLSVINGHINANGDAQKLLISVGEDYVSSTNTGYMIPNPGKVSLTNNASITGLIVSEKGVSLTSSTVTGAITTLDLDLKNQSQVFKSVNDCDDVTERYLNITPSTETKMLGENLLVTFKVIDKNGNLVDINDNIIINSAQGNHCWSITPMSSCDNDSGPVSVSFPITNGLRSLYLYSKIEQEIDIDAYLGTERSQTFTSAGPYIFEKNGGFIFEPSPAYIVAGKPFTLTIKAVDTDDTSIVLTQYEGSFLLDLSATNYLVPATGSESTTFSNMTSQSTLEFVQGQSQLELVYQDAGAVEIEINDISSGYQLSGNLTLNSIPYAFAMCGAQSSESNRSVYSGDATSGDDFAKAGEDFSITVKPIAWSNSAQNKMVNGVLQADQLCSEKVTSNYYSVQSQRAAVNIERGNNYTPTLGHAGTLTVQGNQEFTSKNETSAKNVGQITYNEAGSIEVRFSGEGNGNIFISDDANLPNGVPSIETSSVHMGRFYPDHFTLVSSQVTNAMTSGASPFTYMGQTFDISFLVEARNRDEAVTSNYHAAYLTPTAIESLQLNAVDSSNTDRTSRLDTSSMPTSWNINWIDGVNNLNDTDLVFDRDQTAVLPLTTSPDGPYIITLNLQADHNSCDFCTEFDGDGTAELSGDLVSRYGRIALSDVGGTVDATIKVPLQTQYWNGDQFIINDDDQETVFDGEGYCRRQISPNAGGNSNGQLNESDSVENGSSQSLTASRSPRSPASSDREQVKLWLRLQSEQADEAITCSGISGNTDWLMYNWDENGDEDPSAIVTFGIHRGNDRVIFRGETRMTGN